MATEKIDGLTVEQWLFRVDAIVNKRCGVSVHDLADFCIWDCWQDGMSPANGALEALEFLENDDLPRNGWWLTMEY